MCLFNMYLLCATFVIAIVSAVFVDDVKITCLRVSLRCRNFGPAVLPCSFVHCFL